MPTSATGPALALPRPRIRQESCHRMCSVGCRVCRQPGKSRKRGNELGARAAPRRAKPPTGKPSVTAY